MPHPLVYVVQHPSDIASAPLPLLDRLRTEGFDVWISSPDVAALDELSYNGFRALPIPGQLARNVPAWLGAYFILQAHFLEIRPSLVHGVGIPWAWIASFAARRAEVPAIIATLEHLATPRALRKLLERLPRGVRRRLPTGPDPHALLGGWVDACLLNHESDLQTLLESQAIDGRKLEIVLGGRGVDLVEYRLDEDGPSAEEARRLLELPARARWAVGCAEPWNDASRRNLVRFERGLARTHPAAVWIAAGAGEGPATLVSERSPTMYRALDVFVGLNPEDATGTSMMEAAAMGLPTVAVESPAARTVIADGETGRIVSPSEVPDALASLLDDPATRRDMGRRARARAEQRFDRRHIDEQVLRVYERTLEEGLA